MSKTLVRYIVELDTPKGRAEMEVPSLSGPELARDRAFFQACHLGWGDLDTITARVIGTVD